MLEITRHNFEKLFPLIKSSLEETDIIAIDSEFSGLESDDVPKTSLFDTVEERYEKLRRTSEKFIIIQFGITCIEQVPNSNKYNAKTFNFFLLPGSIPIKNRQFLWQVAAIEFLSFHSFNFNKVVYDGISYLNEVEESTLKQYLKDNKLLKNIENNMPFKYENEIKTISNKVIDWLKHYSSENDSENGKNKNQDAENIVLKISISPCNMQYLLQKILRSRFPEIWTTYNNEMITVIKVSLEIRKMLEKEEGEVLDKALLDSFVGFSKVFKLLVELKKPIVGHNILLDLMYMYKLFYKPLPKRYNEFKVETHRLFPIIYDTKYLSYQLKNKISQASCPIYSLNTLYNFFEGKVGKNIILNSPTIEKNFHVTDVNAHDAGWDSYCTAFIFVKMSHIIAVNKYGKGLEYRARTSGEIMSSLQEYVNCINLSRASTFYLKLDGEDPKSERPQWLFVRTAMNCDIEQISRKLSPFGTVDVKSFMRGRALVAVANHGSAREILNHFYNNKDLYIVPYNPMKHSLSMKYFLIGSAILSGGMVAWVFHRSISKSI
ncbi:pre-piRNA 3'-exonuclease trimmer-like isoform X1 [Vespula squamosa]|uniref:Pre-piRNA 3'-exonuclease trimmer-like isoform X1 n=1 Tax=Vespula squamosa TaxID=30214 RepID=A0ABD2A5X6_VESSQ